MPTSLYNKERLAIRVRILAMARRQSKFSRYDCVTKHYGLHHTDDWQAVLESLVAKGVLQHDNNANLTAREYWKSGSKS